jgi:hypothetical protein
MKFETGNLWGRPLNVSIVEQMTEMNTQIKERWVEELRNGKYKQGQGNLKAIKDGEVRHCCLGVLCELAVEAGIIQHNEGGGFKTNDDFPRNLILPAEVQLWAELDGPNPSVGDNVLANLNDNGGSFTEIARIIEESDL